MMYTAKQVAEMLQVGVDVVKCFVDSGELDAIDVSSEERKEEEAPHPRRRATQVPGAKAGLRAPAAQSRAHRHKPRQVIDYFAPLEPEENGRRRLKVSDVAEYLGVKEDYVRQLIAYGHLAAMNVGGAGRKNSYRISEKELYAFVERSRNKPKSRRAAPLRDFLDNLDKQQPGGQQAEG